MSERVRELLSRLRNASPEDLAELAATTGEFDLEAIYFLDDDPGAPNSLVLEESQLLLRRDGNGDWRVAARLEEWIVVPHLGHSEWPDYLREEGMELMDLYPPVADASAQYLVDNSGAMHFTEAKVAVCWAKDLLAMLAEHGVGAAVSIALSLRATDHDRGHTGEL